MRKGNEPVLQGVPQQTNDFDTQQFISHKLLSMARDRERYIFRNERGRYDLLQLSPVPLDFPVLEAAMVEDC